MRPLRFYFAPRHSLQKIRLGRSNHPGVKSGLCAMEAVAYLAGEPHSDNPETASFLIAHLVQHFNDIWGDANRQRLLEVVPEIVGTHASHEIESKRAYRLLDILLREWTNQALGVEVKNPEPLRDPTRWKMVDGSAWTRRRRKQQRWDIMNVPVRDAMTARQRHELVQHQQKLSQWQRTSAARAYYAVEAWEKLDKPLTAQVSQGLIQSLRAPVSWLASASPEGEQGGEINVDACLYLVSELCLVGLESAQAQASREARERVRALVSRAREEERTKAVAERTQLTRKLERERWRVQESEIREHVMAEMAEEQAQIHAAEVERLTDLLVARTPLVRDEEEGLAALEARRI